MTVPRALRPAGVRRVLAAHALRLRRDSLPWPLLLVLVWDRYRRPAGALIVGLAGAARMAPYVLLSWAVGRSATTSAGTGWCRRPWRAAGFLLAAAAAIAGAGIGLGRGRAAAFAVAVRYADLPGHRGRAAPAGRPDRARATELLVTDRGRLLGRRPGAGRAAARSVAAAVDPRGRRRAGRPRACSFHRHPIPGPVESAPDAVAGMLREVLHCRPALGALGWPGCSTSASPRSAWCCCP